MAQIVILGLMAICCIGKERADIGMGLEEWESDLAEFNGAAWYMEEDDLGELAGSGYVEMLAGPHIRLPKGSYTVSIMYEGQTKNYCLPLSNGDQSASDRLRADLISLEPNETVKSFRIEVVDDIENFELQVIYGGEGSIEINNIAIRENCVRDIRRIVYLFLIFLAGDLFFYAKEQLKKRRMVLVALLSIICMASLPELIAEFYYGHDIWVHLLRIDGIMQELRLGHFPARIHSLDLGGYGYPFSIYYGDIFLYLPAVLRLIGFSVTGTYKFYIFVMNAATSCVSYVCFQKIFRERGIALIGTLVYVTGMYRLADIYVRAAVGEYTAMLAFPILALALYQIYEADDCENWKIYRKNSWTLAVGMSIMIGSHMLSAEMAIFILALICIILFRKTIRKNTIRVFMLAVAETMLLNAYFIIPFLDYWIHVNVQITDKMQGTAARIQSQGVYLGQYFAFFQKMGGASADTISGRMQMTPGPVQMAALVIAVGLLFLGMKNKRWSFYTFFSILALWLASNLFPWNYLAVHGGIFRYLVQVQFPWRFLGIAGIFLTLLLCELLLWRKKAGKRDYRKWCMATVVCAVLMTSFAAGTIFESVDESGEIRAYDTGAIDRWGIGGDEYLRTGTNKYALDGKIVSENLALFELRRQEGTQMEFYCESDGKEAYIEVPLLNYKGYHVRDDAGNEYEITDGKNNVVSFVLPKDFAGEVIVSFEEPILWRVAEFVSFAVVLGMVFYMIKGIIGKTEKARI